jgi:hypothetical protein
MIIDLSDTARPRGPSKFLQQYAAAHPLQELFRHRFVYGNNIFFFMMFMSLLDQVGCITVIGHEDQSLGFLIKSAHGKDSLTTGYDILQDRIAPGTVGRHDHASRLVDCQQDLFNRLPGVTSEQAGYLAVWLRSAVAHWLQLDTLHGNECVPTLIGAQGCGKTTFLCRLLPQHLRQYYLDHLNLSNKFDKEMALTNNLFVNLDELDAIRPSQHSALKQTLSKSKVNGRPIYGASQEDRARYASFVATTNNPHPLTDATGSRRYICLQIPEGQYINNAGEIDYDQLYAQVLHEVMDEKAPYWFSNEEVARIQELNQNFMEKKDMAELVNACFRKPKEGEAVVPMVGAKMLEVIKHSFPALTINSSAKIQLGFAMKELGYENVHYGNVAHYKAVPKKIA